jgi:hypothetical protein
MPYLIAAFVKVARRVLITENQSPLETGRRITKVIRSLEHEQ